MPRSHSSEARMGRDFQESRGAWQGAWLCREYQVRAHLEPVRSAPLTAGGKQNPEKASACTRPTATRPCRGRETDD